MQKKAFKSHFLKWAFKRIQSPLQISKDCQHFEKNLKPCGSSAFFKEYLKTGAEEVHVFRLWTHLTTHYIFFSLMFAFSEL